jgi:signal transduction histidine kinase
LTSVNVSRLQNWRVVVVLVVVIVALLGLTNGFALYEARKAHVEVELMVDNAMKSIELVHRMRADMYRQQRLVDAHILAADAATMAQAEAKIAEIETDFVAAVSAYELLVSCPSEATAWQRLKEDLAAIRNPLAGTLALSRENRDVEARAALSGVEGRLAAIGIDVDDLVRINDSEAERSAARIKRLQHSSIAVSLGFQFVAALLIVGIGFWGTRLVRAREDEVRRHALALEMRNRDLDAFAGRVAHDLRGPLSTISMSTSVLAKRLPAETTTAAILQRGVAHMETIIDDLLALSRIGESAARGGVGDPVQVAEQVRDDLAARLGAEGVTLQVAVEPAKVQCAEGLLRQAVFNLADNAVKYRRAEVQAEIEIRGHAVGKEYELRVSDNGVGMSYDEARQAFDPFFRALRVREQKGTGLGLSIVKRVIEASGGSVAVDSRLGQGTTFVIRLPQARDGARVS